MVPVHPTSPVSVDWASTLRDMVGEAQNVARLHLNDGQNLANRAVGVGPWRPYSEDSYKSVMESTESVCGMACTLFAFDHTKNVMNYPLCLKEIVDYAKTNYDPFDSKPLKHKAPVDVITVRKDTPGELGRWRRGSGDIKIFGMYWMFKHVYKLKADDSDGGDGYTSEQLSAAKTKLLSLVSHVPVDFHYMTPGPDMEDDIFLFQWQLGENVQRNADVEQPSAWQICSRFNHLRDKVKSMTGASATESLEVRIEKYLADHVELSASDYHVDKANPSGKVAEKALLCYDKTNAAGISWMLQQAKSEFGNRSVLSMISKYTLICQKCEKDPSRLKWVVEFFWQRMQHSLMPQDTAKSELIKHLLPLTLSAHDCVTTIPQVLKYDALAHVGEMEKGWINKGCASPL